MHLWAHASQDGTAISSFQAHQKTVYALARYCNHVWSAGSDGLVRVWPLEAQQGPVTHLREFQIMPNHKSAMLSLDHHVISFDTSGAILVFNADVRAGCCVCVGCVWMSGICVVGLLCMDVYASASGAI